MGSLMTAVSQDLGLMSDWKEGISNSTVSPKQGLPEEGQSQTNSVKLIYSMRTVSLGSHFTERKSGRSSSPPKLWSVPKRKLVMQDSHLVGKQQIHGESNEGYLSFSLTPMLALDKLLGRKICLWGVIQLK